MPPSPASTFYSTIALTRACLCERQAAFATLSDPVERVRAFTSAGRNMSLRIEADDFRVGGQSAFKYGRGCNRPFCGSSTYLDIVPDRRIVVADVIQLNDVRLAINLATFEIKAAGGHCEIKLTVQIAWLDGADSLEGVEMPYVDLMDGIAAKFGTVPSQSRRTPLRR